LNWWCGVSGIYQTRVLVRGTQKGYDVVQHPILRVVKTRNTNSWYSSFLSP